MKQNPNFILTDIADSHILVPVGKAAVNFNAVISLNDMGQTVWNMLESETTAEELLRKILAEYDVSEETAKADIDRFIAKLRENGCIEE